MRLIGATIKYLGKNFYFLIIGAIVPAVLLGIFSRPSGWFFFLTEYGTLDIKNLGDVLAAVMPTGIFGRIYPFVLIFISLLLACSLLFTVIGKHMRVGRVSLRNPVALINADFIEVFLTLVIAGAIYHAWQFLLSCALTLNHFLLTGSGTPNAQTMIVAAAVSVIFFLLLVYVLESLILWTPTMSILGYGLADAAAYSVDVVYKKTFTVGAAAAFPYVAAFFVRWGTSFITANGTAHMIVNSVLYLFIITYLICLCMTGYFELTGTPRRDLKTKRYGL